jgi:hypothetical protein
VAAGAGASNAYLGGRIYVDTTSRTNWNSSALTNLMSVTIPAHTLTNVNDELEMLAYGKIALVGTNKWFQIAYGSFTNVVDTGYFPMSNGTWRVWARITRTGNASQTFNGSFFFPHNITTNWSGTMAETNGIANLLRLQVGCANIGGFTNEFMAVNYIPGPR